MGVVLRGRRCPDRAVERVTRIELALSAWEADVLPLNYTRAPTLSVSVLAGDLLEFCEIGGNPRCIPVTLESLAERMSPGHRLLIDDGRVRTRVIEQTDRTVTCLVETGGLLKSRKGVNLPDTPLDVGCLTPKDLEDLAFACAQGVDYVALSFVRHADDIEDLRQRIRAAGSLARIIAKIERAEAIENLDAIVDAADAVMVARGDLGVELGFTEVPLLQKRIIELSRSKGRTVITATQMLESMVESAEPTRAEVSDVANAILDGTSAVMLSAETASGAHPVHAVEMMDEIARRVEASAVAHSERVKGATIATALMHAACEIASEVGAAAIAVPTGTGSTPRDLSRFRPHQPIVAACVSPIAMRQLALDWGVFPVAVPESDSLEDSWIAATSAARRLGLVAAGDLVVLTGRRALPKVVTTTPPNATHCSPSASLVLAKSHARRLTPL